MTNVLLPQAVTAMLPAIVSQLVVIVKDTALGGVMIGFTELLNTRGTLAANYANLVHELRRGGGHLHRAQLHPHQLRELAGGQAAAQQEVHRRGPRTDDVEELNAAEVGGTFGTGAGGSILTETVK